MLPKFLDNISNSAKYRNPQFLLILTWYVEKNLFNNSRKYYLDYNLKAV